MDARQSLAFNTVLFALFCILCILIRNKDNYTIKKRKE